METTIYASDSQLIINLLFKSPFYGYYVDYYKYPYFYRDEMASDFLFAKGIRATQKEIADLEAILTEYLTDHVYYIPDILILLNAASNYYKSETEEDFNIPVEIDDIRSLTEAETLKKILGRYENQQKKKIKIDFEIDKVKFSLGPGRLTTEILDYLKEFSREESYDNIFRLLFIEENEYVYNHFFQIFPEEEHGSANYIRLWALNQSSLLLFSYLSSKKLSGTTGEDKIITDQAAELTGRLLSLIRLLPQEYEYNENVFLRSCYHSYSVFLSKIVRSFIIAARKGQNKKAGS